MKLIEALIPNSEIEWINEEPAVPTTTRREGNVTINNVGSPGRPGYFDVAFRMQARYELDGVEKSLFFTPSIPVLNLTKDNTFDDIEVAALRQLSGLFNALAASIEAQIAEILAPAPQSVEANNNDAN